MESLKAHPMAGNLLLTFPQLVGLIGRYDFDEIKNYNLDLSPYETEEFKKKKEESEYLKRKYEEATFLNIFFEFLKNMNTHSDVSVNVCVKGIGAVEVSVTGEGLNELISFIAKAGAFREIKRLVENLNDE